MFARSTKMGNTRASMSGMSKQYGSHAFVLLLIAKEVGAAAQ